MGDKYLNGLDDLRALPDEVVLSLSEGQHPVRVWREHRGLTVEALASKTQLEAGLIVAIESDELPLKDAAAEILGKALEVKPSILQRLVAGAQW
jgi:ribosome-binding protein aMBF1 (putative translation factor)